SVTGQTDATQPAQLRGLSPDQTLVLINGKRQHTTAIVNDDGPMIGRGSSPADLSAIPMNAIARIEVLRDGASAQYGSDAIAGVINIILKEGADHGGIHVSRGVYDNLQGHTWQGGADGGVALGHDGWVHVAVNIENQHPTEHAGRDLRFPKDPTYNTRVVHFGLPELRAQQAAVNAQYALGDNAQLYAFSVLNRRDVRASGTFHSLTQYTTCPAIGPNLCAPEAFAIYPEGMLPMKNIAVRDDLTVFGLRGLAAGWHYDLSASTGASHSKKFTSHSFNYTLAAHSPTSFYDGTLALRQDILNADFSRDIDIRWNSPLTVAWGLAWRHGSFSIKHGDAAAFTGTGGVETSGFGLANAGTHSRNNAAVYVDLETSFSSELTASLAARHERYDDFGNTTSWKLSSRYALTPVVALRGTVSTGFRAPALQQEFDSKTALEFQSDAHGNTQPYQISTIPVSDPIAIALGARALQPETSRNYSVG
ncbi:MAG: TonB-dependent receptor plug domain-containing protein, partial [Rhodanobacter sp.]